ncbi:HAD family hydrolase [Lacimicrobium alkaliphilum]|uniref:Phosphoglycolate phosphatase, bacterial n=1 Tax=Lacimicrobium alkaliphilum TaxID=1526571 RepID=A0ABQ1QZT3_9ALTE|nr:HAD-IA family hydrolase [Lacimicrobium alkaliphilum]GGD53104.1 phosphoglycolate phosphatase, bacterial [Lacimicrobium alkaliphilum]
MSNLHRPHAFLFDLDGTLLDTARDMGEALNLLLNQYDLPQREYNEYRPIASHGAKGMLGLGFGEQLQNFDYETLRADFLACYANQLNTHTRLFDGVAQLIDGIQQAGLPWGIVTNKPEHLTTPLLQHFPQLHHADIVISGDTLPQRKPHPAQLFMAQEHLAIEHGNIWYIGDAERDILAASAASMVPVLAEYGYICPSELPHQWKASLRISQPEQLLRYIG